MNIEQRIQEAQQLMAEGNPVEAQKIFRAILIECQPLAEGTEQWINLQIQLCYFSYVRSFNLQTKYAVSPDNQPVQPDLYAYKYLNSSEKRLKSVRLFALSVSVLFVMSAIAGLLWFTKSNKINTHEINSLSMIDNSHIPKMCHVIGGKLDLKAENTVKKNTGEQLKIVNDFLISQFEVTIGQYQSTKWPIHFVAETKSSFQLDQPIAGVSWIDAVQYCNWLSRVQGLQECYSIINDTTSRLRQVEVKCNFRANGYRLPTTREWEYAALGGKNSSESLKFSGGNWLTNVGWGFENSTGKVKTVGLLAPNHYGIYDMTGNLWEWCWDSSVNEAGDTTTNYTSAAKKRARTAVQSDSSRLFRVIKGGSYLDTDPNLEINNTSKRLMYSKYRNVGFRVVRTIPIANKTIDLSDETKKRI
jgi:formylglycine-generating enzyme